MDHVDDEELLYRRVPMKSPWYDPAQRILTAEAFKPHKTNDKDGLSLSRAQSAAHPDFLTIEEIARGPSGDGYVVVELRAGDVRRAGITIVADAKPHDLGHVLLPDLNSENYKSLQVAEWKDELRKLVLRQIEPSNPVIPTPIIACAPAA